MVTVECEQALKRQRQENACRMREQNRELTDAWMVERELRLTEDAQHVQELESMSGDRREDLQRLAGARAGAAQEAS